MIMKIFTVYDSKIEGYLQPFFMQHKGAAIRAFSELCNDSGHNFGKYPSDYTLFEVGSWDGSNCGFSLYVTPVSLGVGVEFLHALYENKGSTGLVS